MAKAVSYTPKGAKDDEILLEMEAGSPGNNANGKERKQEGLTFNNGGYKIDYVLVFERCEEEESKNEDSKAKAADLAKKREDFEKALEEKGVLIERDESISAQKKDKRSSNKPSDEDDDNKRTRHFVKLHVPWLVLAHMAEEMNLKTALQENDIDCMTWMEKKLGRDRVESMRAMDPMAIKEPAIPEEKPSYFMATFTMKNLAKFHFAREQHKMFSTTDRHLVIQRLVYATRFAEGPKGLGLKQLLYEGAYIGNYPLHDGDDEVKEGETISNDRQRLRRDWASFGRCFKYQPYDAIKSYFGTEIGLYFAWLGFYTGMLVPLAIAGLVVFIYGIVDATMSPPVRDVCDSKNEGRWIMCPLCDKQCSYWDLAKTTCAYAYVTHFFDNSLTVALAVVSSIWATLFLELWKRRQASLANKWHVSDFEEEETIRPEFAATAPRLKKNPVTGLQEPYVPKRTLYQRYGTTGSIIVMMCLLVIAAVVGVVIYRAAVFASLSGSEILTIRMRARTVTSITAAIINLICINILKFVYSWLAVKLTNWENPRTRTDYEDSFTYKMYLFQFVNTYASIFYIAFFKSGLVIGTPGRYKRIAGKYRLDGCSEQGCFLELCIQLIIIMVGQQIIGNITEIAIPALMEWMKRRKEPKDKQLPQYQQDFDLNSLGEHNMFWEYLEVVLQYGFVTMFVAAFPLAPLFSLLNSIVEIRVDAINFVRQFRRPDAARAEDIGAWSRILEGLTKLSVLVNAFVLSFTSDFVPRLLYRLKYAPDRDSGGSLEGYLNNSLAVFEVAYLEPGTEPENPLQSINYTVTTCRYPGYHSNTAPFKFNKQYWHVIAGRLAFVFVFQYTVYAFTQFLAWLIPDRTKTLDLKIKREQYLAKQLIYSKPALTDNYDKSEML
ncbi:anoctamin-4 isoform X2 [Nematostella vectensis]|uniref:anoctamin-4 isoform X2 n=1 Tax=Nematostella vectensis TaxID=45351 RepID=UPI0013906350|nr:anoctamin-4 isoform X2 [Nematostella vectensis]